MIEKTVTVINPQGLHARPASLLVERANRHDCEVFLCRNDRTVNAKSILGVLTLACGPGEKLKVMINSEDEQLARDALSDVVILIESGFGEEE